MEFITLTTKKTVGEGTDEKIKLTNPTLVFLKNNPVIDFHTVVEDEVGRIDLIAALYHGVNDIDYILKWNNISNPFSINVGDILEIPNIRSATYIPKKISILNTTNEPSIRDQFVDTKRMPVKDANRIEYLKRKSALRPNGSKQNLPPNILKEGQVNINIGNGSITI